MVVKSIEKILIYPLGYYGNVFFPGINISQMTILVNMHFHKPVSYVASIQHCSKAMLAILFTIIFWQNATFFMKFLKMSSHE